MVHRMIGESTMNVRAQLNRSLIALSLCMALGGWAWMHPVDASGAARAKTHAVDATRMAIFHQASHAAAKTACLAVDQARSMVLAQSIEATFNR